MHRMLAKRNWAHLMSSGFASAFEDVWTFQEPDMKDEMEYTNWSSS